MTDRGAVGAIRQWGSEVIQIPAWIYGTPGEQALSPVNGAITITVSDNGSPVNRARVRLVYRASGGAGFGIVGERRTNASGVCSFANLDPTATGAYYAVVLPPEPLDGLADFNAMIFDHLTPV